VKNEMMTRLPFPFHRLGLALGDRPNIR